MSKEYDRQTNNKTHLSMMGKLIADILQVKMNKSGRYVTTWGDKTALGLYRTVKRIIDEDGQCDT